MNFYGLLNLSFLGYLTYTLLVTHITIAAVTIYLHRCQAHRALDVHPAISHFFRFWLWITTGMSTRAWAAIHRKHHAKCETIEDPHSPQVLGLSLVLWQGAELYRVEANKTETLERYGQGTPNDWLEQNLYSKHAARGFYITLVVDLLLLGIPGIAVWAIQMAWIPFFAAGVINGWGHYFGYRNFACPDAATNIVPWGILIGGEELHNNHHAYPTSAKLSVKWWEFDIGWCYIKLLSWLKLATIKRTYPKETILLDKQHLDYQTLKDVITNRIQILTHYTKEVLLPLFTQSNKLASSSQLQKIKAFLLLKTWTLDPSTQQKLEHILQYNPMLKAACEFCEKLQQIWNNPKLSPQELLTELQNWCIAAERTGIHKLKEFVRYLRGYTLQTSV